MFRKLLYWKVTGTRRGLESPKRRKGQVNVKGETGRTNRGNENSHTKERDLVNRGETFIRVMVRDVKSQF